MKKTLFIGLILIVLLLAACGGPKIEGKWESVYSKLEDTYHYKLSSISLDIREDKTITATNEFGMLEGTWVKEGDKYIITFEGEPGTAVFEGNLLVISVPEGEVYYFSRDAKGFKNFPEGTMGVPEE